MFNAKDTQSRYLFMNRYQASLYRTTPEQAVGRTAGELVGAEYGDYTRNLDAEVIRSGVALPFFEEGPEPAGGPSRRWLTSKVPLTDAAGTVWGVATISFDISERTRLEQTLRQAKELAEASSQAQSAFLAAMSHELRTPLNAVIGFAEIIRQQTLGPVGVAEYVDYAEHILNSGRHLLSLINDILDYARIEGGGLQLTRAPVELGAMLRAMLEVMTPSAEAAGVRLVSDLGQQKLVVRADEMRLRQALANIAGNAVKFTPAGGQVTVALRPGPKGGAVVAIADSGIGIDEHNLARVFEPFWQADSGLDRLHEGTGIGLPLARRLIALHGGRLELESRLGEGTVVTMILPAGEDG
jgi:signal transduction histidine kinase